MCVGFMKRTIGFSIASAISPEWVQETGGAWLRASERRKKQDRRASAMWHPPSGAYVSIRYSGTLSATTRHARLRVSDDRRELPLITGAISRKPRGRGNNR